MRLSITMDDDLYAVARSFAKAEDCSLSAAVNRLLRRAIEAPASTAPGRSRITSSSFPTSAGSRLITDEDVATIEDER